MLPRDMRPVDEEHASIRRAQAREARMAQHRENATPELVQRVLGNRSYYPWVRPAVIMALSVAGFGPEDPVTAKVADTEPLARKRRNEKRNAERFNMLIPTEITMPIKEEDDGGILGLGSIVPSPKLIGSAASGVSDIAGGVADVGKAVGRGSAEVVDDVVGESWEDAIGNVAKPAIRGAMMAVEAPYQAVQGAFRNKLSAASEILEGKDVLQNIGRLGVESFMGPLGMPDVEQTNLGVTIDKLGKGEEVRTGSGFFVNPESEVGQEQARRAREAYSINGQAGTFGRFAANAAQLQPGSKPYDIVSGAVDATAILFLDPANVAGGQIAKARRANRLFKTTDVGTEVARTDDAAKAAAGAIKGGTRNVVLTETVGGWVNGEGARFMEGVADLAVKDPGKAIYKIYKASKEQIPVSVVAEMVDSAKVANSVGLSGADAVKTVFNRYVIENGAVPKPFQAAPGLRRVKPLAGWKGSVMQSRKPEAIRMFQDMPDAKGFLLDDLDQLAKQFELHAKNVKVANVVPRYINRIARSTSWEDRHKIVFDFMDEIQSNLIQKWGLDPEDAREMTRLYGNEIRDGVKFNINDAGQNIDHTRVMVDGEIYQAPRPHQLNEYAQHVIPSPDIRKLRRATSRMRNIVENVPPELLGKSPVFTSQAEAVGRFAGQATLGVYDFGKWWTEAIFVDVWRPLQLISRPVSYLSKMMIDDQLRMYFGGFDSMANDPSHAITAVVSNNGRVGKRLNNLAQRAGKRYKSERGMPSLNGITIEDARELRSILSVDAQGSITDARFGSLPAEGQSYLHNTVGRPLSMGRKNDAYRNGWHYEMGAIASEPLVQGRIGGVWGERDFIPGGFTGNHVEDTIKWLLPGGSGNRVRLRTIKLGDTTLESPEGVRRWVESLAERAERFTGGDPRLREYVHKGTIDGTVPDSISQVDAILDDVFAQGRAPGAVRVPKKTPTAQMGSLTKRAERVDNVVQKMFRGLIGKPTDRLARERVFREAYFVDHAPKMMPFMTPAAQQETIAMAVRIGEQYRLPRGTIDELRAAAAKGSGKIEFDDADVISKSYAAKKVESTLYDLGKRGQFFDQLKIVFPFGDAWKEIAGTWARLAWENPIQISNRLNMTIKGGRQSGFFYENDQGEEVFAFPLSEEVNKIVTGVPWALEGRLQGLNLASNTYFPGFGPAVQMTVGKLIPTQPTWDWAREILHPYGDPIEQEGFMRGMAPAWGRRLLRALDENDNVTQANVTKQVMAYLVSTGEYSTDTQDDIDELVDVATKKARTISFMQAMLQAGAPTGPSVQERVQDKSGKLALTYILKNKWSELNDEDRLNQTDLAIPKFLALYGEDAFLVMQSQSDGGFLPTEKLHEWVRENPKAVRQYKAVYGYFAPQGGDYSFEEADRQVAEGERKQLTPREYAERGNHLIASMMYRQLRDSLSDNPSKDERAWLRKADELLHQEYPGYRRHYNVNELDEKVRDLQRASKDKNLARTEAGEGLKLYLGLRASVQKDMESAGLSPNAFRTAKRAEQERAWLRKTGQYLVQEYPDFRTMWIEVFDAELADPAEDE